MKKLLFLLVSTTLFVMQMTTLAYATGEKDAQLTSEGFTPCTEGKAYTAISSDEYNTMLGDPDSTLWRDCPHVAGFLKFWEKNPKVKAAIRKDSQEAENLVNGTSKLVLGINGILGETTTKTYKSLIDKLVAVNVAAQKFISNVTIKAKCTTGDDGSRGICRVGGSQGDGDSPQQGGGNGQNGSNGPGGGSGPGTGDCDPKIEICISGDGSGSGSPVRVNKFKQDLSGVQL